MYKAPRAPRPLSDADWKPAAQPQTSRMAANDGVTCLRFGFERCSLVPNLTNRATFSAAKQVTVNAGLGRPSYGEYSK
ncbi:MAG: hypothetical protein MUO67_23115 [Anaerolineales bacterium]|nr:hypothetical protein [Anaerolineales bacterium]